MNSEISKTKKMQKNDRIAVCISGEPRSLNHTHESILKFFKNFQNFDIFAYIPKCPTDSYVKKYLPEAHVEIREDEYIDDTKMPDGKTNITIGGKLYHTERFKTGKQRYLQQINGWKESNRMRKEYEASNGFKYDWVIRSRIDVEYVHNFPSGEYTDNFLYIPNFHHFNGVNDRFAMGSAELMNKYLDIIDIYKEDPTKCLHAESFLKYCLDYQQVPVKLINFRFMRIREDGQKMQNDLTDI